MAETSQARPHHRLAVGVFEDAGGAGGALCELRATGSSPPAYALIGAEDGIERSLGPLLADAPERSPLSRVVRHVLARRDVSAAFGGAPPDSFLEDGAAARHRRVLVSDGPLGRRIVECAHHRHDAVRPVLSDRLLPFYAKLFQNCLEEGRLLLCVDVCDDEQERAVSIALLRHSNHAVHVHDLPPDGPPADGAHR